VVLRGDHVVPQERTNPPFWFHDHLGRNLFVSTRHLTTGNAKAIAQAIAQFGARTLRAYPSAAYELAKLTRELDLTIHFDSIITGSEPLYPAQRDVIEGQFGGRAFVGYGMAERVAYAAECEHGRMHVNPEYGYVEIVDAKGRPTDEEGFVVGTSFHNHAMPLIRYQLEDTARWDHEPCPCGRSFPVLLALNGRMSDWLFDLRGMPVNPTVLTFPFKGVDGIRRAQVAQVRKDQWIVRLIPEPRYSEADAVKLLQNFRELVSVNLNIQIVLVEDIQGLPNGKYKWVVQEWQPDGTPAYSSCHP
jgi:phenylacetate-CoA ligase